MKAISDGDEIKFRPSGREREPALSGRIVSTSGGDPAKPIGVLVRDEAGAERVEWIADQDLDADFFVAVYYVPRLGIITKTFRDLEEFDATYAQDRFVELRRYVNGPAGWTTQPVAIV
jgi:hypothetical protein